MPGRGRKGIAKAKQTSAAKFQQKLKLSDLAALAKSNTAATAATETYEISGSPSSLLLSPGRSPGRPPKKKNNMDKNIRQSLPITIQNTADGGKSRAREGRRATAVNYNEDDSEEFLKLVQPENAVKSKRGRPRKDTPTKKPTEDTKEGRRKRSSTTRYDASSETDDSAVTASSQRKAYNYDGSICVSCHSDEGRFIRCHLCKRKWHHMCCSDPLPPAASRRGQKYLCRKCEPLLLNKIQNRFFSAAFSNLSSLNYTDYIHPVNFDDAFKLPQKSQATSKNLAFSAKSSIDGASSSVKKDWHLDNTGSKKAIYKTQQNPVWGKAIAPKVLAKTLTSTPPVPFQSSLSSFRLSDNTKPAQNTSKVKGNKNGYSEKRKIIRSDSDTPLYKKYVKETSNFRNDPSIMHDFHRTRALERERGIRDEPSSCVEKIHENLRAGSSEINSNRITDADFDAIEASAQQIALRFKQEELKHQRIWDDFIRYKNNNLTA